METETEGETEIETEIETEHGLCIVILERSEASGVMGRTVRYR